MVIRQTGERNIPEVIRQLDGLRQVAAWQQLAVAGTTGGVAAGLTWPHTFAAAALLVGWDAAALIYLALVWTAIGGMDATVTARRAAREDPSNSVAALVLQSASVVALVAIAFCLLRAGQAHGSTKAYLIGLGVISVVLSWLTVHTVFMLRYARGYYQQPGGGIDFNEASAPAYIDFAYFSFTIGMTFQVSDTNITTTAIRRVALHHALMSYLFGAVILAVAINVVASLLR
jgi:uncharacterized membrane protein